jgi:hypothetical protein
MVIIIEKEENPLDIKVEECLVAFLDIIKFESYINDFVKTKDTSIIETLVIALKNAEISVHKHLELLNKSNIDFKVNFKQFSDCTSISFVLSSIKEFEENKDFNHELNIALLILRDFQIELLKKNIYIRGGVSLGIHFENENMIFSEGIVNSYKLESKKAVYPRIIIHNNLFKSIRAMFENHEEEVDFLGFNKGLICDWDGVIFINPFNNCGIDEKYVKARFKEAIKKYEVTPIEDPIYQLKNIDEDLRSLVLKDVKNQINELKSNPDDYNKLRKYLWLKELISWNRDPESSKIKFENLKLEHLQ